MPRTESLENVLSLAVPEDPDLAVVLLMIRKIAEGNLREGELTELGYQAFGREYERPLTLIRAYLIEVASASTRQLRIVRQNHARMTRDEGTMLDVLSLALRTPDTARSTLGKLCANQDVAAPLAAAQLLARALTDLGCPLGADPAD